ncbi:glycosyltransferase [uncultured Rubinisphaera sp.]|uniref:glycosyltransferase n=1 Tax=uncultured Rubinisphaera sp. TaxID=1678686 RepID=UPI0030D9F8F4
MKFCDITLSYNEASGGIRTYLDEKRKYLMGQTDHEHVLIVPAETDEHIQDDRLSTYHVASPYIPGNAPYRLFWKPGEIAKILNECQPDVIELGSCYISPWAAFQYRKECEKQHGKCLIGGYFHTDAARILVEAPFQRRVSAAVGDWSETLESLGYQFASLLTTGVESYVGATFERCDLKFAASPQQAQRLEEYGVSGKIDVVPLGIDLQLFQPSHRSEELRQQYGIQADEKLLIYGGRLVNEKNVPLLIKAYKKLSHSLKARLLILGEGPLRDELQTMASDLPGVDILPYESDPPRYAALLASADVYVTAGPHETFGLSVIEAQASGLPVVGVDAGALKERVVEGTGYLSPVNDASTFAENIEKAIHHQQELSEQAYSHVVTQYSWTRTFNQLIEIYEKELKTSS